MDAPGPRNEEPGCSPQPVTATTVSATLGGGLSCLGALLHLLLSFLLFLRTALLGEARAFDVSIHPPFWSDSLARRNAVEVGFQSLACSSGGNSTRLRAEVNTSGAKNLDLLAPMPRRAEGGSPRKAAKNSRHGAWSEFHGPFLGFGGAWS